MAVPSIDLETAKAHLNVAHDLDDELIELFCQAAIERTVMEIGLAGSLDENVTEHACRTITFDGIPVEDVSKVEKWSGGEWVEMESTEWTLTAGESAKLEITTEATRYRVTWEGGFGETPPAWFKVASLFLVGHYYENRSAVIIGQGVAAIALPMAFEHLTAPHRRWIFS